MTIDYLQPDPNYRNNDKTQLFESLQPELYVEDKTDAELSAETDAFEAIFPNYPMCEGVYYSERKIQVEQVKGRIIKIDPDFDRITEEDLCKARELEGLYYHQSRVRKVEQISQINHCKYDNVPDSLYKLTEIINKHNPVWIETYETTRKGLNEVLAENSLHVCNYYLENIQIDEIDYEKNIVISLDDEIGKFYELNGTYKGLQRTHAHDILFKLRRFNNYLFTNDEATILDSYTRKSTDEKYSLFMNNVDEIFISENEFPYNNLSDLNLNNHWIDTIKINKQHLVKNRLLYPNTDHTNPDQINTNILLDGTDTMEII